MKLQLWYPSKPYIVTQAWGIKNPIYERFGFSRHNGVDFTTFAKTFPLYAPVQFKVIEIDYQENGSGNYLIGQTVIPYDFEDGKYFVELTFMHLEKTLCVEGQIVELGERFAIADNTGFSTGSHTHLRCRRVTEAGSLMDMNDANASFNHSPYFNGFYAQDGTKVAQLLSMAMNLLRLLVGRNKNGPS